MMTSSVKKWDVALVGELYIDHIMSGFAQWPKPGEEVVTDSYTREVGGGAANTACGLAKLGRSVSLVGLIGTDDEAWFRRKLSPFGLSTHALRTIEGQTGMTVSLSTREDRSFFTHLGVNRQLESLLADPHILADLAQARHVHFAMPLSRTLAATLLPILRAAGCATSLDVGFQPDWLPDPANHPTLLAIDHLLPNEKEAALFCGGNTADAYFTYARQIGLRGATLKLGAAGAALDDETTGSIRAIAAPKVAALDSTGAGDAFDAGFLDALLDGASAEERLRRACVCGALSTRAPGALGGIPDRSELWSVYEQSYPS